MTGSANQSQKHKIPIGLEGLSLHRPTKIGSVGQSKEHRTVLDDLPLELKYMIFENVFQGSEVTYRGQQFYTWYYQRPRPETDFVFEKASSHRNLLLTNKKLRSEAIEIFYRLTKLKMSFDWTRKDVLKHIPKICRKNVRSLEAWGYSHASSDFELPGLPQCWMDPGRRLQQTFANLCEIHLPSGYMTYAVDDVVSATDDILAVVKRTLKETPYGCRDFYNDFNLGSTGLKVYQEVVILVQGTSTTNSETDHLCREVRVTMDCSSREIVKMHPEINEKTTLEELPDYFTNFRLERKLYQDDDDYRTSLIATSRENWLLSRLPRRSLGSIEREWLARWSR